MRDLRDIDLNVSRETLERLDTYCQQLERWSAKINLIAPTSQEAMWKRHIIDSAQLFHLRDPLGESWCDLGSGGGLPGIVLAIIASELSPGLCFDLVESDARKAAFLRIISKDLSLNATIHHARAEGLAPLRARTLTARALAPLDKLLGYVQLHMDPDGVALLPKGRNHAAEISAARKNWTFDIDLVNSVADEEARILCVRRICKESESA
ncbi:MAG: 16S rRNA (guanine(527)-N(7))-methyltransferase RsmG [Pararhodobacter sp.]|nr:16S rRNA (guanine(527)-N(7))-methyltransferase RsmG [Pararhodobacter sp.]